jgi:uncharacterized cupredoxin-like copper-binding protein
VRRLVVLLSVAILGTVALGSCGGDDDTGAAPDGSGDGGLKVVAHDIEFGEDRYAVTSGDVDLQYVNQGSITHTLLIDDVDGFKLEVTGNGDVDRGRVALEPGAYTLYCDVPGHREAGMEATLEVT